MSKETLKSIARRGSLFVAAAGLLAATAAPAAVFADALNPLTERSLLLTSSSPGYVDTDGSGNSEADPGIPNIDTGHPGHYAPPGSGPNGKKTGQTFSFRVSTDSTPAGADRPIKAFTLQYCTTAAGKCQAPGNNTGDAKSGGTRGDDSAENKTSDLNVNYTSPVAGTDFEVWMDGSNVSTGWSMAASNVEDQDHSGPLTGKNNFITLTHEDGIAPEFNDQIRIIFKASSTNYITNPGAGHFFVKMNTYDSDDEDHHIPTLAADVNNHIIDGGVTVANVMTDSIHITTKVLETMAFSVGTHNRDTEDLTSTPEETHGPCDAIEARNGNRLNLGNENAEFSLETDRAYDVYSYWRLSSNSSGGATVYYSGDTLKNTVEDEIKAIGPSKQLSLPGKEQFGLAFVGAADEVSTSFEAAVLEDSDRYKLPVLTPLQMETNYDGGEGRINTELDEEDNVLPITASFAFDPSSLTSPVLIAQNTDGVLSCATAKMRYVANIEADTPAGVYTTKVNYLAAPQY